MKSRIFFVVCVCVFSVTTSKGGTYSGGDGTSATPYLISTPTDLNEIGIDPNDWDKEFVLTADIDMSGYTGTQYNIIGTTTQPFAGKLDGRGHVIRNFSYSVSYQTEVGLIGYMENAVVCNVGAEDVNMNCPDSRAVGVIAGTMKSGTISQCYVSGGAVSADQSVGAVVGVTGSLSTVEDCYCATPVTANNYYGALVGECHGAVNNSFYDTTICGSAAGAGTGLTTSEMYLRQTYTDADWEFLGDSGAETWWIYDANDYPQLVPDNYYVGLGTQECPFLIYRPEDLNAIGLHSQDWNKHFKVMRDINMSGIAGTEYNTIAPLYGQAFSGVFDGSDFAISNLAVTCTSQDATGMFGNVSGANAVIQNLNLNNITVYSSQVNAGGICGVMHNGTLQNINLRSANIKAGRNVGGLAGNCLPSSSGQYIHITDCTFEGLVESTLSIAAGTGGIAGSVSGNGLVEYCWAKGAVTSAGNEVGGICGSSSVKVRYCHYAGSVEGSSRVGGVLGFTNSDEACGYLYAQGRVEGSSNVGGLIGKVYGSTDLWHCYSACAVEGGSYTGGLIGDYTSSSLDVHYCYWDTQTSGRSSSDGGSGKSIRLMQKQSTYLTWDFENTWQMIEDQSYPSLLCFVEQFPTGDITKDHKVDYDDLAELASNWLTEN